jgi:hypothetical protein
MTHLPIINLTPPSEAYREATRSIVYRLSELMFGSLLAAYSLGFVGAIAAQGRQSLGGGFWGLALLAVQYLSISITFAFLTTSFYITYHIGILTMPQLRFERIGKDFKIAIVQAIFFGVSMIEPALFPMLLGASSLISLNRKNEEFEELVSRLYKELCHQGGRNVSADPRFIDEVTNLLRGKDFQKLSPWGPIDRKSRIGTWIAITIGFALIVWCLLLQGEASFVWLQKHLLFGFEVRPENKWYLREVPTTVLTLVAAAIISRYGSVVLKQRASFLGFPRKGSSMDQEFTELQNDLQRKCKKLVQTS